MSIFNVKIHADDVITKLLQYEETLYHQMQEFTRRLAEEGALVGAQYFYRSTAQEGEGVTMTVEPLADGTGYAVCGNGEAVGFLEFGAGDYTMTYHPFANEVPFDVSAGSWSSSPFGSGEYSSQGYWYFGGQKYTGVPAHAGMLKAWEEMQNKISTIVSEVFG